MTTQHEHLVSLARSILFVYECIGVLVYRSVNSQPPGAAEVLILPALAETASKVLFPFVCTLTQHELRTKYHKSAIAPPGLSPSCFRLTPSSQKKSAFGLTVHTDAQGLLSGLSLLFQNLASADDTVLIFPYHDSLPMCLFILVIVPKARDQAKYFQRTQLELI